MIRLLSAALFSLALTACFTAVPEAQCLRDSDCDAGTCQNSVCTGGTGQGGGTGTGGGTGQGGGANVGGGTTVGGGAGGGGVVGGGAGGGVVGGGAGGGAMTGGGSGGGVVGGGAGGGAVTGGGAGGGSGTDGGVCGCVDRLGNCQVGNSPLACGANRGMCATCGFGEQCVNGACVSGACGPQSCAGCCTNNFCVVGNQQNRFACGTNGQACMQCPQGMGCVNGTCMTPPPCNATTCPTGCCQNNQCVTQQNRFVCGIAGAACNRCPMGQDCFSGVCLPTGGFDGGMAADAGPPVPAGSACTTNAQCQPPQAAYCLQANIAGQNTGYAGGYCTANCGANQPCAAGGVCITDTFFGMQTSTCRAPCSQVGQQSTCRAGYVCAPSGLSSVPGYCRPRCDAGGALSGCGANQMCNTTTGVCQ